MKGRFSMAYGGPLSYFAALIHCREAFIDPAEAWQKQSYRNRCYLDAPNGKLMLNIPIDHVQSGKTSGSILVSDAENWRSKHWQAFKTTYNLSPFFEELAPDLEALLFSETTNLYQFNLDITRMVLNWLRAEVQLSTKAFEETHTDFTEQFHPKKEKEHKMPPYAQVFAHKHGFLPNLSVFDLLFNEGPAAYDYLANL